MTTTITSTPQVSQVTHTTQPSQVTQNQIAQIYPFHSSFHSSLSLEHYEDVLADLINGCLIPIQSIFPFSYETFPSHIRILKTHDRTEITQHLQHIKRNPENSLPCTLLLYFGTQQPWREPASPPSPLDSAKNSAPSYVRYLHMKFPESIPYSQTLIINVAFLPSAIRNRFTSDFRIVADYFYAVQTRRFAAIRFHNQTMKHPEAVLELLWQSSHDIRFQLYLLEEFCRQTPHTLKEEKGGITMCDIMDYAERQGITRGFTTGLERGIYQELYHLIQKELLTIQQAAYDRRMSEEELVYKFKQLGIL